MTPADLAAEYAELRARQFSPENMRRFEQALANVMEHAAWLRKQDAQILRAVLERLELKEGKHELQHTLYCVQAPKAGQGAGI